jgi:hypothetical protein
MKRLLPAPGLTRRISIGLPVVVLFGLLLTDIAVQSTTYEPYPSPNERFGFGAPGSVAGYDVGQLHAGWYVDWGTSLDPPHPAGMEYAQMVRLHQLTECWPERIRDRGACPYVEPYTYTLTSPNDKGQIVAIAQANPGSLWLIGNEIDRYDWGVRDPGHPGEYLVPPGGQDEMLPQVYAQAYHELYHLITSTDPEARIAIGGVIQPTPLRLQYLDMILDAYHSHYGATMPVEVWNIHNMILREVSCEAYPGSCYGADVPPGVDAAQGRVYGIEEAGSIERFEQHIREFRGWMKDRGVRDKPLIISEYSVLYGEDQGFYEQAVEDYLLDTFDYLTTASDGALGYPADGDRLVQRWAWYSLDDAGFEGYPSHHHLFDPETKEITQLGVDYGEYAGSLVSPYRDLRPVAFTLSEFHPSQLVYSQTATLTLRSRVVNWGNTAAESFTVDFWDGEVPLAERIIPELGPRYQGEVITETVWSGLITGPHTFRVTVDSDDQIDEWREDNNEASTALDVDLSIAEVWTDAPLVEPGETTDVTVTARLSSQGDVTVEAVTFELWNGDGTELIGTAVIPSLEPGAAEEITLVWSERPAGCHPLVAMVDPQNRVTESDEQNNEMGGCALVPAHSIFIPLLGLGPR